MEEEKLVIEGLEITCINSNKNITEELFSSRDNFVYQYVSILDTCVLTLDKAIKDGWFILSISKYNDTTPDFNNYLITTSEADKIIRYFGITGKNKQESMVLIPFIQEVGQPKEVESELTVASYTIEENNYMDAKEFVTKGYLQEANRRFFHPLGLALTYKIENDNFSIDGVKEIDDKDGYIFYISKEEVKTMKEKKEYIDKIWEEKTKYRKEQLGYIEQPIEEAH